MQVYLRNGEEWYRLRQAVQQLMMRPKQVQYFLPLADSVAEDLANYIQHNRNKSHQPSDFWRLVQQWVLECKLKHAESFA